LIRGHLLPAIRRRPSRTSSIAPTWARQTGLSVAFDLPTQTGYDSDHPLARGEVGKVGVPVSHLGDMRTLFDGIPLDRMNTSMTINAPAAWLLSSI
jgi:(2R)-ethylmalonyl-CoA mutase